MNKLIFCLVIFFGTFAALKSQSTDPAGCVFQGSLYSDSSEVIIGLPFVLFIRDNNTDGCQLYVQYATQTGNPYPVKPSTIIRLLDDYNDIVDQGASGLVPFLQNGVNFSVNRDWVESVYEGSGGRAMIVIRDGRTRFLTDESYAIIRARFIVCPPTFPPSYLIDAENGLYVANDTTVRMGGFLIENTTITTEGYNWMMKDTLSSVEFGIDYLTPDTGDTTVYWGRRSGSVRQMMQMGNRYWYNIMKDTVGGLYSDFTISWASGDPILKYVVFNPLAPNSGTVWFQLQKDNAFLVMSNETTNPYYTPSLSMTNSSVQIGVNESGSGDPGNGVGMGAYGFGTTEYLYMITKGVDDNTATTGQFLQLINETSGEVDFATIDLSGYLPISDTAAMLDPYISLAGWGLLKSAAHTLRVDSAKVATRYYVGTNPTTIANTRIAVSDGSNLVGYSGLTWNNGTTTGTITGTLFGNGSSNFSDATTLPGSGTVHSTGLTSLIWNKNGGSNFEYAAAIVGSFSNSQDGLYIRAGGDKSADRRMLHIENTDGTNVFSVRGDGTAATLLKFQVGSSSPALLTNTTLTLQNASSIAHSSGSGLHFSPFGASNAVVIKQNTGNLLIGTTTDVPTSILTARSNTKSSSPFPFHTTTESNAITGVSGNFEYITDGIGPALSWSNGTRKAYALESTFARGTNTLIPFFDANGQATQDLSLAFNNSSRSINLTNIQSGEVSLNIDALVPAGGPNPGKITYTSSVGYASGLEIASNKYLRLYSASQNYVTYAGSGPMEYGSNFVGINNIAACNYNIVIGGAPASNRASTSKALLNATDGNYGSTGWAVPLFIRGGNASVGTPTNANGGDVAIFGGTPIGTGIIGDVLLQYNGSSTFGNVGVKTFPTQDFDINGDAYIRDSIRLTTTPAHTAITGLLTRDASGWVGLATIGTGLSYSGGVLTATASAPTQILAESYNRITSTSSPQPFSSTISDNIVDQGGTQASFTFDFPASPVDGQVLTVTWNNAISTVTLNGNGNTIVGTAVTTAVAGTQRKFKYCGTCTTPVWIKIY
jgi:hypothetical protein